VFIERMRAAGRQPFIDQEVIERLKSRTLTAEDVRADIDAWLEAVMVVTMNAERHRVNLLRAKHFAKRHGMCVILFPKKYGAKLGTFSAVLDPLYDTNEVMWEIFVVGAPAYLLENIDPAKGLVNGTPVTLHSLSFTATSTLVFRSGARQTARVTRLRTAAADEGQGDEEEEEALRRTEEAAGEARRDDG
jgi:hypothetical protein